MDFNLSQAQSTLIKKCRNFAEKEISPYLQELEEEMSFRQALFQKMAHAGLFSLSFSHETNTIPDTIGYALGLLEIAKADAGISVAMAVTNMVAEAIDVFGSDEQKARYLLRIKSGELVPCSFALTEKNAGSDAKSIQMQAQLDPADSNYYLLNGDKQLITNADLAGVMIVIAKIEISSNHQAITAFLVERETPGFEVVKKERKLGLLTANLVSLHFDKCRIPVSNLLGGIGNGLKIALNSLDRGRIGIAAQSIGIAEAAFEAALRYAINREQFGQPLIKHEVIAFKFADMHTKLSACRQLLLKCAWQKDQGLPFTMEAAEAKLFCSEACNEIVSEALQIFGGYGYTKDYPVEKFFRDARVTTIYEGTSEIQRLVISRHLLASAMQG